MAITHATSAPGTPPPVGLTVGGNEWNAAHVGGVDISALAGDLLPSADDTYDIGSASKRWAEGWIGGLHLDPSGGNPIINAIAGSNGLATFRVVGLGAQLSIAAADGDDDHTGGELAIASGKGSANSSGGDIQIIPGNASGGGDGGNMTIQSGATIGVGAGDAGELSVHAGNSTDGAGGVLALAGGDSTDWHGGNVTIQAGQSANSTNGRVTLYEGGFNYGIEIQPTHIYFAQSSPPTVPAIPVPQDIVDALVTLGLIAQSA